MPRQNKLTKTAIVAIVVPLTTAIAQEPVNKTNKDSWVGVVTSDEAIVRCGANKSYYPIATADSGDLVKVVGKRQEWLSVELVGGTFENTIGYIKYPEENTDVFSVVNGRGIVCGDLEVLANNTESDELYRSWRPVLKLHYGDEVQIINTTVTAPGTLHREPYVVHTVSMPANATGWINTSYIQKSNEKLFSGAAAAGSETNNSASKTTTYETGDIAEIKSNQELVSDNDNSVVVIEDEATKTKELVPLSLAELEAMWKEITNEPVMGAEVSPLKDMYVELLDGNQEDLVLTRISGVRIKQLEIWSGLQEQRVKIDTLRTDLTSKSKKVSEYQTAMSMYGNYEIVGRLSLSHTFDGRLRPFMYRILDQNSGRTLGYLPANEDWELSGFVGQLVGISGESNWDPTWRVNIVDGDRFDILSPTTATVTPDIQ